VPRADVVYTVYGADGRDAEEADGAVADDDRKRAAHRALVDRVLNGEGRAAAQQRARAFGNDDLSPPLPGLIGKVATRPAQVTEADFAAAKASGFSEDQLFELVVCAAVGQSARLYEAGLAALAEATANERPDNAT
jgi:alkylhydroperoxidase family enzyme